MLIPSLTFRVRIGGSIKAGVSLILEPATAVGRFALGAKVPMREEN